MVSLWQAVIKKGFIRGLCLSGVGPQVICGLLSHSWVTAPSPCQSVSVSSAPNQQIPAPSCKRPAGRPRLCPLIIPVQTTLHHVQRSCLPCTLNLHNTFNLHLPEKSFFPHAKSLLPCSSFFLMITACTCTLSHLAYKRSVCELHLVPLSATCFLNISVDNDNFPPLSPSLFRSLTYLGALPVLTLICLSLKMHSKDWIDSFQWLTDSQQTHARRKVRGTRLWLPERPLKLSTSAGIRHTLYLTWTNRSSVWFTM